MTSGSRRLPTMTIELLICPCCKRPVHAPTLDIVIDNCKVGPMQARILGAIWKGKGEPVETEVILAAMDRGSDAKAHAYSDFKVHLCRLRQRLKFASIAISNVGYAQGYRIVFQ